MDGDIGVGGLGGVEVEGTGLLEVDCLLIPKGQVGCGYKRCGQRAGFKGLVFLVTRVREGREAPLGTVVGNV